MDSPPCFKIRPKALWQLSELCVCPVTWKTGSLWCLTEGEQLSSAVQPYLTWHLPQANTKHSSVTKVKILSRLCEKAEPQSGSSKVQTHQAGCWWHADQNICACLCISSSVRSSHSVGKGRPGYYVLPVCTREREQQAQMVSGSVCVSVCCRHTHMHKNHRTKSRH